MGSQFKGRVHRDGEIRQQEPEAADRVASSVRKQRVENTWVWPTFLFYSVRDLRMVHLLTSVILI